MWTNQQKKNNLGLSATTTNFGYQNCNISKNSRIITPFQAFIANQNESWKSYSESMKSPSKSISHPLFKLSLASPFAGRVDYEFSLSMSKLISYVTKSNQIQTLSRLHFCHTQDLPSCLNLKSGTKEFVETCFLGPSKHAKTITKIQSFAQNDPPKVRSVEFETKYAKPVSKTIYSDPMFFRFSQKRSLSTVPLDPFSRKTDFGEANASADDKSIRVESRVNSPFESSPPIDAGHSMRKPISLWPGMYHSPVTNALWDARSSIFERLANAEADAPPQSELITKTPSMSRTSIVYKFSTDYILREQYRNPWNEIRMGKLLEDLDALAGTISIKHCSNNDKTTRLLLLVTASVDKIVLRKPIRIDTDLTIEGAVTWVGRSSLEIQLELIQPDKDTSNPSNPSALTANFTFVARDSKTGKSAPVNQISPESEREILLWKEAEERNKMRKMKREEQKRTVDNEEANRLNQLLAEGRIFCEMPALADRDSILIKDTCLQNSLVCQPQQRNIHGRIFGGFLMRRAFELAYATAYSFAGTAPCFMEVDHVDFLKPVDVGNFLRFKSCVLYTELEDPARPLINVEVVAHVTRPELRSCEVSNKFHFTFSVRSDAIESGLKIRNVVPATQEEARRVIERIDAEKSS